jgi:hypothetical protein
LNGDGRKCFKICKSEAKFAWPQLLIPGHRNFWQGNIRHRIVM